MGAEFRTRRLDADDQIALLASALPRRSFYVSGLATLAAARSLESGSPEVVFEPSVDRTAESFPPPEPSKALGASDS